jgi:isocitrate lyase
VVRPPFEESIFATPAEALAWLESRNPEVSAARVMASIHAAVPGFDHLTW